MCPSICPLIIISKRFQTHRAGRRELKDVKSFQELPIKTKTTISEKDMRNIEYSCSRKMCDAKTHEVSHLRTDYTAITHIIVCLKL